VAANTMGMGRNRLNVLTAQIVPDHISGASQRTKRQRRLALTSMTAIHAPYLVQVFARADDSCHDWTAGVDADPHPANCSLKTTLCTLPTHPREDAKRVAPVQLTLANGVGIAPE